jgi:hypothetical protein
VLKAFHAVDAAARDRLHADLVELCHAYRSEGPGPRGIDATYLRAIGRRA